MDNMVENEDSTASDREPSEAAWRRFGELAVLAEAELAARLDGRNENATLCARG